MKLRFLSAIAAGAILVLGIAETAVAQMGRPDGPPHRQGGRPDGPPPGGMGRRMGGGPPASFLLRRPDVQKDLKLTGAQIAKVNKLNPPAFGGPGGGRPDFAEFAKQRAKADAEASALLTAPQKKRLKEISLQLSGPFAVFQPDVQKALGVTDKQRSQILEAIPRFGGRRGPGGPGGGPGGPGGPGRPDGPPPPGGRPGGPPPGGGGFRPGGPDPRKEIEAKIAKVLTAKQRGQLKTMSGKPFKADPNWRPGPPRR